MAEKSKFIGSGSEPVHTWSVTNHSKVSDGPGSFQVELLHKIPVRQSNNLQPQYLPLCYPQVPPASYCYEPHQQCFQNYGTPDIFYESQPSYSPINSQSCISLNVGLFRNSVAPKAQPNLTPAESSAIEQNVEPTTVLEGFLNCGVPGATQKPKNNYLFSEKKPEKSYSTLFFID
ncbi:hypothetical protein BY996DRAFT_2619978 [Phakopsora pachyrhizi]|nr:hypothetical protein BY996DRAFT_2619978 [Phakopsora pachyrhizi]